MYRFKISWLLFVFASLIWLFVAFQISAFAAGEQQFVWTATTQPIPGSVQVIEMKPTMLAPKGMPPAPMRSLLTRVLGKSLGGIIPSAGIVYSIIDLEGQRQSVAYAIEQLMKDGQPVNPQTIQEWIANNHGIDTSSNGYINVDPLTFDSSSVDTGEFIPTPPGATGQWIDKYYYISSIAAPNYSSYIYSSNPYPSPVITYFYDNGKPIRFSYTWGEGPSGGKYRHCYIVHFLSYSEVPPSPEFNPADYPQYFGPDFFPSNAIDALVQQGLDSFDLVLNRVNDDLDDHVFVDVTAKYPTAETEWTEVYANGQTYRIPIGALGGSVVPKYQPPSNSVDVQTSSGQTTLSNTESQPFIDAGVPPGATIVQVNPQTGAVTYVDPATGESHTTQVSKNDASNLTNNYNVYNTFNNSTETTNIHQEISLPEVHVSGSIDISNGSLEPVTSDRVDAARTRFQESWNNLKLTFSEMFSVNLTGIGRLPVWNWPMLGQVIVIDFNNYADELNWLGLAFLFFATISSVFIVINH
jgi:hypothetical protein